MKENEPVSAVGKWLFCTIRNKNAGNVQQNIPGKRL